MSYFKNLVETAAQVTERGLTEFWMGQVTDDGAAFIAHYKDNKFVPKDTLQLDEGDTTWIPMRNPNYLHDYDIRKALQENPSEAKRNGMSNKKFDKLAKAKGYFASSAKGTREAEEDSQ